jgi:hypothetical protein
MKWRKTYAAVLICCTLISTVLTNVSASDWQTDDEQSIEISQSDDEIEAHLEEDHVRAQLVYEKTEGALLMRVSHLQAGRWITNDYRVTMLYHENERTMAKLTDLQDGASYRIDSTSLKASLVFVPLAVVVGELLLVHLLTATAVLVIAGVTYVAASEVADTLRNREHEFYAAYLDTKKGLFIGAPIRLAEASARLNSAAFRTNNVWSTSKSAARLVAQTAGGLRTPILDMAHGPYPLFLPHFHRFDRKGGHSFFS